MKEVVIGMVGERWDVWFLGSCDEGRSSEHERLAQEKDQMVPRNRRAPRQHKEMFRGERGDPCGAMPVLGSGGACGSS